MTVFLQVREGCVMKNISIYSAWCVCVCVDGTPEREREVMEGWQRERVNHQTHTHVIHSRPLYFHTLDNQLMVVWCVCGHVCV